jgi:hypothetical protein
MNLNSAASSAGFLVGIYFLASAVVALVLVYFSRPGAPTESRKAGAKQEKSASPKAAKTPKSAALRSRVRVNNLKGWRVFQKFKSDKNNAKKNSAGGRSQKNSPRNQPGPKSGVDQPAPTKLKNNADDRTNPANQFDHPAENLPAKAPDAAKEISGGGKPVETVPLQPAPAATPAPNPTEPITNISLNNQSTLGDLGNTPTPEKSAAGEKPKPEETQNGLPGGAGGAEMPKVSPLPSINVVNENGGKIEMEEKPKTTKMDADFSELFVQDNDEENEVSRLAKELVEVDTQDILETSQTLIDRMKKQGNP